MHRLVHPPPAHVVSEGLRDLARQLHLCRLVEMPLERGGRRLAQHLVAQRDEPRAQRAEHVRQGLCGRAGLVIVQKRIVDIAALGQRRPLFALERQHLAQRRRECREIVARPRLGPDALGDRGHPRQFRGKLAGHLHRAAVAAPDVPQVGLPHRVERRIVDGGQPVAHPGIGAARMQHAFHRRHLVGALPRGAARHHGFLVPGQPPGHLAQRLGLALERHQVGICIAHAGVPLRDWGFG